MKQEQLIAAETWDRLVTDPPVPRTRFWQSPTLIRLLGERWLHLTGCKTPIEFIRRHSNRSHFKTALVIGCGAAGEQLPLLKNGVVDRLILSDISEAQLGLARAGAASLELDLSRIDFRGYIDFGEPCSEKIDLVYWRDSLHHMLDTDKAIAWSLAALQGDGVMYCHDACPPNRMQWGSEALDWVERFRIALPSRCLAVPDSTWRHPPRPLPESVDYWLAIDPTECADTESIIPALKRHAPQSLILYRGGLIYGYALNDILANFDEDADGALFHQAMLVDDLLSHLQFNFFFTSLTTLSGAS